jgi:pimeloyl-ACP methyl ester carboxylesterase
MSTSNTAFRFATILFLLAGLLLLKKPVFGQTAAPLATKPAGQTITAAPTRFSVVIQGKGADVILIPGLASSRDVYSAEAKLLAPNYRLHLIQVAGFAGEPAGPNATGRILTSVVDQLHQYIVTNHLQPVPVIGHSLGGLLALMLVHGHPEDVSKLLIIDTLPYYGLVFNPNATVDMVRPQAQVMHDQFVAMPNDQFAASQPLFTSRLVKDPEGQRQVSASSIASDRTVFANAMLEDLSTDLRPQLASIKTPATLLYPYETAQGPVDAVTALYTNAYATMPDIHLIRIDDSRHFIMYDQPAAFDNAVRAFLKSREPDQAQTLSR